MAVDTPQQTPSMMFYCNTMMATSVLIMVTLLAASLESAVVPISGVEQKVIDGGVPKSSSVDLYNNMVLAEQELERLGGNSDDDNENNDKGDASLLSMMTGGDDDNDDDDDSVTSNGKLRCVSCTGVLPTGHNNQDTEHLYCMPDGGSTMQRRRRDSEYNDDVNRDQSICFRAVRCWKAKVRELDGRVRVSRGCVRGHNSDGHVTQMLLHPCMGTVPVIGNSNETMKKNGENSLMKPPYTVWTSSATGQQQKSMPPPSYAIECCAGRDLCNSGPFPSLLTLPDDNLIDNNDSLLTWWRWSPLSVAAALMVFIVIITVIAVVVTLLRNYSGDKQKRRWRHKRRKRSTRHCDNGDSDDSDKKGPRRNLSISSMSSSSLSSIGSSSCCEGKTGRKKSSRKPPGTALTMVDLLKGVVITRGDDADSQSQLSSTIEYTPTAINESMVDGDLLPPPYQRREENDWTSGSGYGMPVLVQRTLAKQIQLRELVGKGRYGEVWRATYWNGGHEHVAVKIFLSKDEPSWKRETEIYSTVLMRHDNILGFIGSDIMTSRNSYTTQLLLITHYHQYGSLYDFLQTTTTTDAIYNGNIGVVNADGSQMRQNNRDRLPLTMRQMLNVLYTVASGLCHLHTEIHGTQGKPGIAHRDVKSKNILIKCARTGACCVADFGMAVTSRDATLPAQTTTTAGAGNNQNTRVGTKRYMAPEVLDESISSAAALASASASTTDNYSSAYWCFDAYRRGDVYSYALVMWEVLSRTIITSNNYPSQPPQQQVATNNEYNPYVYRAPYQDRGVGWDPGFDDMRNIVCSADPVMSRPGVASEWLDNPIMNAVVATMRECWHGNPNARLPTLRVKKTLTKLILQHDTDKEDL